MVDFVVEPAAHWLYQLANAFLLISYLSPHVLVLRILLACGCLCFALWGLLVLAVSVDSVVWNMVFFMINVGQALLLIYRMRPVQFDPHLEAVYEHFFSKEGVRLSRSDFRLLTHNRAHIKALEAGDSFARRQHSRSNTTTGNGLDTGRSTG
jgi:hypothetical protein